jgi:hypothetical protein
VLRSSILSRKSIFQRHHDSCVAQRLRDDSTRRQRQHLSENVTGSIYSA